MEQGNPNKIDAIVEEIVKNNSIFKLKSPIEQEKEKALMAKSINSSLSVLNEAGKELVLQDLSVDPDEKFKGFIDSVGNIDITGITQYTASIVKVKIEEAEREGINLRRDAVNINKSDKTIVAEAVISMAVITNMISNYENLSHIQRNELLSEGIYSKLSDRDRQELNRKVLADVRRKNLSEEERKKVDESERQLILNEAYIKLLNENPKLTTYGEIVAEFIKKYPELDKKEIRDFCKKYHSEELTAEENVRNRKADSSKVLGELERISLMHDYNDLITDGKFKEARALLEPYKGKDSEIDRLLEEIDKGNYIEWNESKIDKQKAQGKDIAENRREKISNDQARINEKNETVTKEEVSRQEEKIDLQTELEVDFKVKNFVQREISQLSDTLINDGISKDQIKESMIKYTEFMKEIPLKFVDRISSLDSPIREEYLTGLLVKKCHVEPEIAKYLSEMKFDGQLIDMLKNEDRRAEFIEQLGQAIEQIKGPEVANEAPNQDMQNAQPLPEDVSAELNAIPVALQRINCQPEDIAKGMEAYKQIIDRLSSEEIEGTQEKITQTLKKAAEELGLDGVVGDILNMMTQITFNGQIAEILKNCKTEFLNSLETLSMQGPLLDPRVYAVNPEQYSNNTGDERIDENTLKAGFSALAVDLQVAEQTIIRPEELVSDTVDQRKDEQVEMSENPIPKEGQKENLENKVIKKLQSFFGVFHSARTSEQDLEEEMEMLENLSQRTAQQQLQNTQGELNQKALNQTLKEDEDLTQE